MPARRELLHSQKCGAWQANALQQQMPSHYDEQAMNEADQLRRAKRWAEDIPNESASTSAALDAFDPEVRSRVVEAANLGATMNIYKVGG
jgi:hypothetical protein